MKFITDAGTNFVMENMATGEKKVLDRYGVWEDKGPGTATVIEVGPDLDALQAKHGPDLQVFDMTLWKK